MGEQFYKKRLSSQNGTQSIMLRNKKLRTLDKLIKEVIPLSQIIWLSGHKLKQ